MLKCHATFQSDEILGFRATMLLLHIWTLAQKLMSFFQKGFYALTLGLE